MRVSVTQLETFQDCQVLYDYRHIRRIRPVKSKTSAALSVGREVADCLEAGLMSDSPKAVAMSKTKDARVIRCLQVMPDDVWDVKMGVAEDKMEVQVGRHTVVGLPDLWHVEYERMMSEDDHPPVPIAVHVEEFKTCGDPKSKALAKAIAYEDWGEQATRYAALLWKNYPWLQGVPFYRRHVLLSWHEKANIAYPGRRLLISQRALDQSLADMERIIDDMERTYEGSWARGDHESEDLLLPAVGPVPHYSRKCEWCEMGPICIARIRSGDTEYVIETSYEVKERYSG